MGYVDNIHDLLSLSKTNTCLRNCISLEMVVTCAVLSGGTPLRSIQNLVPLIRRRAIYVPKALRLLRIVIPGPCEFCNNEPQYERNARDINIPRHHRTNLFTDYYGYNGEVSTVSTSQRVRQASHQRFGSAENISSRPTCVRPSFGVKACFTCLRNRRRMKMCGKWTSCKLNSTFDRLVTRNNGNRIRHYVNAYYEANRNILFHIFGHPRVLAYPGGTRFLQYQSGRLRTTTCVFYTRRSEDRYEYMWNQYFEDDHGDPIGPLVNRTMISDMVDYLHDPSNKGLDHFIDTHVPNISKSHEYESFMNVYMAHIDVGLAKQVDRKTRKENFTFHRRMMKINEATKAIANIIACMNVKTIFKLRKNRCVRGAADRKWLMSFLRRMLLCYAENYNRTGPYLWFRTGSVYVDAFLQTQLHGVLVNPELMTKQCAYRHANEIYQKMTTTNLRFERMTSVFVWGNSSGDMIRQTFSQRMYHVPERDRHRSAWTPWKDPSSNRLEH